MHRFGIGTIGVLCVLARVAVGQVAGPIGPAPVSSGPQFVMTPVCPGFTPTAQSFTAAGWPIADNATTQFMIAVSGAAPSLWDVDVTTFITHTACWDLYIYLVSPAGTRATLTTDNGGTNDDVFNGTVWDDSSVSAACSDWVYSNGVLASPMNPEGSLTAFRGENPNGIWTL